MTKSSNKSMSSYLKQPYSRVLIFDEESGTYAAEILEFPGCIAQGATAEEANKNLEGVAASWIEAALGQGQIIPEPFVVQGYGGKIALRLPRSLHKRAIQYAQRENVSLNQFLVSAIAERIGAEQVLNRGNYTFVALNDVSKLATSRQVIDDATYRVERATTSESTWTVPKSTKFEGGLN